MQQEYIGAYRVSKLSGDLRIVDGRDLLSKEEAAKVFRASADTIWRLDYCSGNPTWIKIKPEEIGREPIREWGAA